MDFVWDQTKEKLNIIKHGISFLEAIETFSDPKGLQFIDARHSHAEKRYYWVGKSRQGKILTTRFTMRANRIRIIGSAEWRKFRKVYDETAKNDRFKT